MARILIVEDDIWLGEVYAALLIQAGYEVRLQRDIYDAMDCIDEFCPSLIVLDLLLPWANGLQLVHELASHRDLAAIPVIIYSNALPESLQIGQIRHYGVAALLHKAEHGPQRLLRTVGEVLRAQPAN